MFLNGAEITVRNEEAPRTRSSPVVRKPPRVTAVGRVMVDMWMISWRMTDGVEGGAMPVRGIPQ